MPFALLPYTASVAVWAVLKCLVFYLVVRALGRRVDFARTGFWWLLPMLLCGGFVVQEFGLGNAQFLIFGLVAASLLSLDRGEWPAAFPLALAASLKIWPLFFVPYLVARRRTRLAMLTMALIAGLTLLPAAYFGWSGNIRLLREWFVQEWTTGSLQVGMWFPGQSLSGILQRYLTRMDYSTWTDRNYVQLHLLHINSVYVPWIWGSLASSAYLGLLWLAHETVETGESRTPVLLLDSLAFCTLPLLEPFAHRIAFVVLLWPATVAAALVARQGFPSARAKTLIYAAAAIEAIEAVTPGARMQRLFQIVGVDFWATCILTAGLLTTWLEWRRMYMSEVLSEEVALDEPSELAGRRELVAARLVAAGKVSERARSREDDG